ncbi:hypothetical protein DICA4_F09714 [Diutina catenulata]
MDDFEADVGRNSGQLHQDIAAQIAVLGREGAAAETCDRLQLLIDQFEPLPTLLDDHLQAYVDELVAIYVKEHHKQSPRPELASAVGQVIYYFCKIRGFKHITNYFSSDVYVVPWLLEVMARDVTENEMFLCLMWLCNLVLVPFDLDQVSGGLTSGLFDRGNQWLGGLRFANGSKNQTVASIMMARLVTRVDLAPVYVPRYFTFVRPLWDETSVAHKLGHLMTVNRILKRADRSFIPLDVIEEFIATDLGHLRFDPQGFSNLSVLYLLKVIGNTSLMNVGTDYKGVAAKVTHTLEVMDLLLDRFDANLRYAAAKSLAKITAALGRVARNYQYQLVSHILTLDSFDPPYIPRAHTILLYLGYLSLQRSVPLESIPAILKVVRPMLFYEQHTITTTVGTQLRDSSCFVLWGLCRQLGQGQQDWYPLLVDTILVAVMDKELSLRRCGIAVLQEMIGRHGQEMFSNQSGEGRGEFVIQLVEMFTNAAVSTLMTSYQLIPKLIAMGFDQEVFTNALIGRMGPEETFAQQRLASQTLAALDVTPAVLNTVYVDRSNIYALANLLATISNPEVSNRLNELCESYTVDPTSRKQVNGYIRWCTIAPAFDWEQVAIVVGSPLVDPDELSRFVQSTSPLPDSFIGLVKESVALAEVILTAPALTTGQREQVLDMALDKRIDCNVRAMIVEAHGEDQRWLPLLDDYTTTIHGDVGSKVRLATLNVLKSPVGARLQLLRLMGEPMDKISGRAYSLLTGRSEGEANAFELYPSLTDTEVVQFWRGVVCSIGGVTISASTINTSLRQFFSMYLESPDQLRILNQLLTVLEINPTPTIHTFIRIFDAHLPIPDDFDYYQLLKTCYNLHINTTDYKRVEAVIALFARLYTCPNREVSAKVAHRLVVLCGHRLPRLRHAASEAVAQVLIAQNKPTTILNRIDLAKPSEEQMSQLTTLLKP